MPSLIIVRHGQASFGGERYDVLSERGREQARLTAAEIVARGGRPVRVISGGLRRQRETAAPIADALGIGIGIDDRWDEYDAADVLGRYSATTAREDRPAGSDAPAISSREFQRLLDDALRAWIAAGAAATTDESFPAFDRRVRAALRAAADGLGRGESAVVVTSGGVLGAICMRLLQLAPETMIAFNRIAVNAALTKAIVGAAGMTLASFNEHGHLERAGRELLTYR